MVLWVGEGKGLHCFVFRTIHRASDRNSQKNTKCREIGWKYFQIHVGKTYLILFLAIRPVLFTPNVQIYLESIRSFLERTVVERANDYPG